MIEASGPTRAADGARRILEIFTGQQLVFLDPAKSNQKTVATDAETWSTGDHRSASQGYRTTRHFCFQTDGSHLGEVAPNGNTL